VSRADNINKAVLLLCVARRVPMPLHRATHWLDDLLLAPKVILPGTHEWRPVRVAVIVRDYGWLVVKHEITVKSVHIAEDGGGGVLVAPSQGVSDDTVRTNRSLVCDGAIPDHTNSDNTPNHLTHNLQSSKGDHLRVHRKRTVQTQVSRPPRHAQ
jgi:hypothetical protein